MIVPLPISRATTKPTRTPIDLLEGADEGGVSRLGLEAAVEEERVLTGPPGLGVRHTPSSDTNAVVEVQACLGNGLVVGSGSASNVKLSDGNLRSNGGESLEGAGSAAGRGQVRLGACDVVSDSNCLCADGCKWTYQCHR